MAGDTLESNKALVREFYRYLDLRDLDHTFGLCADDLRWGGSTLLWDRDQMLGTRGAEQAWTGKAAFKARMEHPDRTPYVGGVLHFRVHGMTAEGDRVAVEVESYGELPDGPPYNNWYHNVIVVRDGKIASISGFADSAHARDVLGPWRKKPAGA